MAGFGKSGAGLGAVCLLAGALGLQAREPLAVRVLPQPLATNREPFRIGLQMGLSDPAEGWSGPEVEALRGLGLGAVRWPVQEGLDGYDWYQAVGPRALRAVPERLGTAEFVRFCRQLEAAPQLRVVVPAAARAGVDPALLAEGAQRAADWVAYCNAPTNEPLGRLRARHGLDGLLGVRRWEVAACGGEVFEGVAQAYAAAMRAAEGGAIEVARAEAALSPSADRTAAEVLRRLAAADPAERAAFGAWYEALGVAADALSRLRRGDGVAFAPYAPAQLLPRTAAPKPSLSEAGRLIALFNRFPAQVPLAVEGLGGESSPFRLAAAWTEDPTALVIFIVNTGHEPQRVRVDLAPLKRRFAFWAADQLAADLTARRALAAVPLLRRQKAGSALSQVLPYESGPASFARIVVKEP